MLSLLAEDGADAADDAGDVVVADDDEGAGELGLDVDAVVAEEARRVAVEDGGEAARCRLLENVPRPCGSSGGRGGGLRRCRRRRARACLPGCGCRARRDARRR
jgi:hypothetical protein